MELLSTALFWPTLILLIAALTYGAVFGGPEM